MFSRSRTVLGCSIALAIAFSCVPDEEGTGDALPFDGGTLDVTQSDVRTDTTTPVDDASANDANVGTDVQVEAATDAGTDAMVDASFGGWAITQISIGVGGAQPDNNAAQVVISGNGRFVAFTSTATNLVASDTNGKHDVFVYDRQTALGTLERVSVSTAGAQSNGISEVMGISFDGRYVLFTSDATDLVAGDTNGTSDLFVRDRVANTTERVSVTSAGGQALGGTLGSVFGDISDDGRFVAFQSDQTNLVTGDTNGAPDVFLRDLTASSTARINVMADGGQVTGLNAGIKPHLSRNGRFVVFGSNAASLGAIGFGDVFLRDIEAGISERVSVPLDGGLSDEASFEGRVSDDGRYVLYLTRSKLQFADDTNDRDDLVLRDRDAGTTINASARDDGGLASNSARRFALMPDAGAATFNACAPLTNEPAGVGCQNYVRDFRNGEVVRVSAPPGVAPTAEAEYPAIAGDGNVVAFLSRAQNISSPTPSAFAQVFIATRP